MQIDSRLRVAALWLAPLPVLFVIASAAAQRPGGLPGVGSRGPAGADTATLDCLVQPSLLVELGSSVPGIVEEILVDRGDQVEKGQLLVQLEASVERATVELASARAAMRSELRASEASLALGQRRVSRKDRMFEKRAVSRDALDEAETEVLLGELRLEQARENNRLAALERAQAEASLRRRAIYSPFGGVVVDRRTDPGVRVDEGPVLELAQLDPLRVEVIAPAQLFGTIAPGMRARVATELPVGGSFEATVKTVDPMVDAASGRFGVELELPNPERRIPAGLRCSVELLPDP